MKLLEALEQAAHPAVGVVDRLEHLLDTAEGVLAQLDDDGWLPSPEQAFHEIDRIVDAPGEVEGARSVSARIISTRVP